MSRICILLLLICLIGMGCAEEAPQPVEAVPPTPTASTSSSEFSLATIHFGIVVSDLDRALDFYQNVIGMTRTGGFDIDADLGQRTGLTGGEPFSVTVLKLQDGDASTQWKLMSFDKERARPKSDYIQDDIGVQYVTIMVTDMQPFLDRIAEQEVTLLGETPVSLGDGNYFVLVQDPDGTFVELIGPWAGAEEG